jgi:hypothetical protein
MDPCLFYITHGGSKKRTRKWTRHDKQAIIFQPPDSDDKTAPGWTEVTQRITTNIDTNEIIENTVINTTIDNSLTRKLPNSGNNSGSTHTHDLDAVGTNQQILDEIFKQLDDEWSVKETPVDFMLGVKRTSTHDDSGKLTAIEHTMDAYVKGAAESFREFLPKKTLNDPFPPGLFLSKLDKPDEEEIKRNQDRGYLRAVGMIVWAVRNVFFKGKFGASVLCGVMGCPGDRAFNAAMHMLAYMEQHSNQGIKFSADGNETPVLTSDASNKPDGDDGKAYGGFTNHWMNGPTTAKSFKLKHGGLSSEQQEYMALTTALRSVVWMRQLFNEIGLSNLTEQRWVVYGDNIQTNRLCKEHFVSTGNQHIFQTYHYNQEVIQLGHATVKWVQTKYNLADIMSKAVKTEVINSLGSILCGYGNLQELIDLLESSPQALLEKRCIELGGISHKPITK